MPLGYLFITCRLLFQCSFQGLVLHGVHLRHSLQEWLFLYCKNANPILENIPSITILFMSPFGLMEVAAYSIAMSRSYMIVHKIIKRMPIRPDARIIGLEIAILVALLLTGGFVEYFFIESIITDMPKI